MAWIDEKRSFQLSIVILTLCLFVASGYVYANDTWKEEFDYICSKTDIATTLTLEELNSLIERCDKLKPSIDALDESQKKLYQKRLKMCRDMFIFVLESKKKD